MRLIALNYAIVIATLQRANCASKAGTYPYAGAYADGAPRSGVVPLQAFLPTVPSIRWQGARSTAIATRSSIRYTYNPSPSI